MFDGITTETKTGGRKVSSLAVSLIVHGGVIVLALVGSAIKAALPKEEAVQVVFKAPPPPPPPPPASKKKATPRPPEKKPITPKVMPQQIIQPKEIPKEEPPPPEEKPAEDDSDDEGVEGGVEGGVAGGVVGGVLGGVVGGTGEEGPPQLLGSGMTPPRPTSECRPAKPAAPEQARQMGITGLVLVEFVVHSDGHVGEVVLKNPTAPPILFEAVRTWLLGCPYSPSMQGSRPIPVKIIQPFTFKAG